MESNEVGHVLGRVNCIKLASTLMWMEARNSILEVVVGVWLSALVLGNSTLLLGVCLPYIKEGLM
jgi:hypothetical protein